MNNESRIYSTAEIAKVLGVSIHKAIAYVDRGFVVPSVQDAAGHGSRRKWSYADLIWMCIVKHFEDLGLSVALIREISSRVDDDWFDPRVTWAVFMGPPVTLPFLDTDIKSKELKANYLHVKRIDAKKPIESAVSQPTLVVSMGHFHRWAKDRIAG